MTAARAIKRTGQWMLARGGVPALARWRHRDALVVLVYHNVVANDDIAASGERSLHISRARFADQLDLLRETHEIVAIGDVLNGMPAHRDRPRALITFDDAYRGALTLGAEELHERGLPATIFVAPAFVGGPSFWWDRIGATHNGEIPPAVRETALSQHAGDHERVLAWAAEAGIPLGEPHASQHCASLAELRAAAHIPGITFGSHTWSHSVIPALAPEALRRELLRPLAWLRDTLGSAVPALAFPYAMSAPHAEREARRLGYAMIFPGGRGWLRASTMPPFVVPRVNVPAAIATSAFLLRLAGLA